MANKILVKRGTAAQIAAATPDVGEPCWATDTDELYLGDGTQGGIKIGPATGGMSSWTAAADSGTPETVSDSETMDFTGGSGIGTSVVTGTLTVDLDILGLTAASALESADTFPIYDSGATANAEATITQLKTYMQNNLSFTTANDGTLGSATSTAGATDTDVEISFSGAYSADTADNRTVKAVVGPALTALATLMTTATAGFITRSGQDTYSVDTTSYEVADTAIVKSDEAEEITAGWTFSTAETLFTYQAQFNDNVNLVFGSGDDVEMFFNTTEMRTRLNSGMTYAITDSANGDMFTVEYTTDASDSTVTVGNDLVVAGDLTVQGTTTTVESTTLRVADKNIDLNYDDGTSETDASADQGGITLHATTDKTILWVDSTDSWDFNQSVKVTGGISASTGMDVGGSAVIIASDVDDAPVDAATTDPISSNWAFDHVAIVTSTSTTGHPDMTIDGGTFA